MYRKVEPTRVMPPIETFDFRESFDPENRWIKIFGMVPWDEVEELYARTFINNGAPAHSARLAIGSFLIQKKLKCTDMELIQQIKENPYLQYVLGAPSFTSSPLIGGATLVDVRKRLGSDDGSFLDALNEMIIPKLPVEKARLMKRLLKFQL